MSKAIFLDSWLPATSLISSMDTLLFNRFAHTPAKRYPRKTPTRLPLAGPAGPIETQRLIKKTFS
jgi:hypothetical protein